MDLFEALGPDVAHPDLSRIAVEAPLPWVTESEGQHVDGNRRRHHRAEALVGRGGGFDVESRERANGCSRVGGPACTSQIADAYDEPAVGIEGEATPVVKREHLAVFELEALRHHLHQHGRRSWIQLQRLRRPRQLDQVDERTASRDRGRRSVVRIGAAVGGEVRVKREAEQAEFPVSRSPRGHGRVRKGPRRPPELLAPPRRAARPIRLARPRASRRRRAAGPGRPVDSVGGHRTGASSRADARRPVVAAGGNAGLWLGVGLGLGGAGSGAAGSPDDPPQPMSQSAHATPIALRMRPACQNRSGRTMGIREAVLGAVGVVVPAADRAHRCLGPANRLGEAA